MIWSEVAIKVLIIAVTPAEDWGGGRVVSGLYTGHSARRGLPLLQDQLQLPFRPDSFYFVWLVLVYMYLQSLLGWLALYEVESKYKRNTLIIIHLTELTVCRILGTKCTNDTIRSKKLSCLCGVCVIVYYVLKIKRFNSILCWQIKR